MSDTPFFPGCSALYLFYRCIFFGVGGRVENSTASRLDSQPPCPDEVTEAPRGDRDIPSPSVAGVDQDRISPDRWGHVHSRPDCGSPAAWADHGLGLAWAPWEAGVPSSAAHRSQRWPPVPPRPTSVSVSYITILERPAQCHMTLFQETEHPLPSLVAHSGREQSTQCGQDSLSPLQTQQLPLCVSKPCYIEK